MLLVLTMHEMNVLVVPEREASRDRGRQGLPYGYCKMENPLIEATYIL